MKRLLILGSTGSVGTQAIQVATHLGYPITAITANENILLLEQQIRCFHPKYAVCVNESAAKILKQNVSDTNTSVFSGLDGILNIIREGDYDLALNGIVGMAGTLPTIEVIKAKKNIALANKECIVTAGELILNMAKKNNVKVLSMDSEHSAIFQCLQDKTPQKIRRIILTASGGPFFGKKAKDLKKVTLLQTLAHPNWSMGTKISIDCATLVNKGLEIIEAARLFDVYNEQIDVIIHRESIIHSLVEFSDLSVLAQLSPPDMRLPIQYAITYPYHEPSPCKPLDLAKIKNLSFSEPDTYTFKGIHLCREALKMGGTAPTIVNAANEVAVDKFINGELDFLGIVNYIENALLKIPVISDPTIDDIFKIDEQIRG